MRVAVDIDGVINDWGATVRFLLNHQFGIKLGESDRWHYVQETLKEMGRIDAWDWLWDDGVKKHGLYRHGNLYRGSIEAIRELKEKDFDLVVATHRPVRAVRDTVAWLDYHFGAVEPYPWSGIYLLTKEEPKSQVPADVLIDDKWDNVIEFYEVGRRHAILFNRPWNQDDLGERDIWRAYSWGDVIVALESIRKGREDGRE